MRSAWAALVVLAACGESSFRRVPLELSSVEPSVVSARGGTVVSLRGRGFAEDVRVTVGGHEARVGTVSSERVEVVVPALLAGRVSIEVSLEGSEASLHDALSVEPLRLAFAEAPAWQLPPLGGVVQLAAARGGVVAATSTGLVSLAWVDGELRSTPLVPVAADAPAVHAFALSPDGGALAACTGFGWSLVSLAGEAPVVVEGAFPTASPCRRLAFGEAGLLYGVGEVDGTMRLHAWRVDGEAPAEVTLEAPPLPRSVAALVVADLDGDGVEELVVGGEQDGPRLTALRRVSLSDGTVRFVDEGALAARDAATHAVVAFDADGDGDTDLFAAGDGQDALLVNDGTGRFFDDGWRALPFERANGRAAAAGDLNRDGTPDLVIANESAADRLFVGGTDTFRDETPALGLDPGRGGRAVALVDLDADGDDDVVTVAGDGSLRVRMLVEPLEDAP